jgi:hypothetical protein
LGSYTAADLPTGFAFSAATLDAGQDRGVASHPGDGDLVLCAVELAVAETVEPLPAGAARRGRDGGPCRSVNANAASVRILPARDPPGRETRHQTLTALTEASARSASRAGTPETRKTCVVVFITQRRAAASSRFSVGPMWCL